MPKIHRIEMCKSYSCGVEKKSVFLFSIKESIMCCMRILGPLVLLTYLRLTRELWAYILWCNIFSLKLEKKKMLLLYLLRRNHVSKDSFTHVCCG
jgi:hypothetical protein